MAYNSVDYEVAKARKMDADADLAELKLQTERGLLVKAEDVAKAWEGALGAMKGKLMSIPTKAAPVVAGESEATACQHLLESLVYEALEELANYEPDVPETTTRNIETSVEAVVVDTEATPKADRKRVGRPRKAVGRAK